MRRLLRLVGLDQLDLRTPAAIRRRAFGVVDQRDYSHIEAYRVSLRAHSWRGSTHGATEHCSPELASGSSGSCRSRPPSTARNGRRLPASRPKVGCTTKTLRRWVR